MNYSKITNIGSKLFVKYPIKQYLKNIILFVIIIALSVVSLNVISAIIHKGYKTLATTRHDLPNYKDTGYAKKVYSDFSNLETDYISFTGWRRLPYKGETTNIDNDGYRKRPNLSVKPMNDVNVFFGGSTMWGTGVDDYGTIPYLYDTLSNEISINAGETGYISRQNIETLINLITDGYKIKRAVFYDGVNDVAVHCRKEIKLNSHGREQFFSDRIKKRDNRSLIAKALSPTIKFIKAIIRDYSLLPEKSGYVCDTDPKVANDVAERLISNWKVAKAIAEGYNIDFIAVLQPVAYIGSSPTEHLKLNKTLGKQYQAVYPIIRKMIKESTDSWIFDFSDILDTNELFYVDFCHLSKNGNALIAQRMTEAFSKQ